MCTNKCNMCEDCVVHGITNTACYHHLFYVDARRYVWISDPQTHHTTHTAPSHNLQPCIALNKPVATDVKTNNTVNRLFYSSDENLVVGVLLFVFVC